MKQTLLLSRRLPDNCYITNFIHTYVGIVIASQTLSTVVAHDAKEIVGVLLLPTPEGLWFCLCVFVFLSVSVLNQEVVNEILWRVVYVTSNG